MSSVATARMGKKKVILVVDDDPDLNELICNVLNDAGYETMSAFDGPGGMELARDARPDLVLLDIMLPGMNGIDVCRTITKDEVTRTIPIIMVTVKNELASKLSSYIAGARRFISKLDGMDGLVSEVEKVLK